MKFLKESRYFPDATKHVGTDEFGNRYYENLRMQKGQHRWVRPANDESHLLWDASNIPAGWHRWMHHTTDTPPNIDEETYKGKPIVFHTDVPDQFGNVNEISRKPWRPNPTYMRTRGTDINSYFAKVGQDEFYTQPGHPMNPYGPPEDADAKAVEEDPKIARMRAMGVMDGSHSKTPRLNALKAKRRAMNADDAR